MGGGASSNIVSAGGGGGEGGGHSMVLELRFLTHSACLCDDT